MGSWNGWGIVVIGAVCTGGLLTACVAPPLTDAEGDPPADSAAIAPWLPVTHRTYELPQTTVEVVLVPPAAERRVAVAVVDALTPLAAIADRTGAIAAINGGFFDPQNGLTTSYVTVDGAIVADPTHNDRLMTNPDLQAYLPAILNRSEFRIYDCNGSARYDITPHTAPTPADCTLAEAVGAGPQLLPVMTGAAEGFWTEDSGRDVLGRTTPNARSAVGIKADGTVVWAIATQRADATTPTGMTLAEMADFLTELGVQKALNLDGGSSTGLYFEGQTYPGRWNADNSPVERPIKSILLVQ